MSTNVVALASTTCTACNITFDTVAEHRAHYKLDWHRFNLKRKSARLPPVTEAQFQKRKNAALKIANRKAEAADFSGKCNICSKTFTTLNAQKNHEKSKKHAENLLRHEKRQAKLAAAAKLEAETAAEIGETIAPNAKTTPMVDATATTTEEDENEMQWVGEMTDAVAKRILAKAKPLEITQCVFCCKNHSSLEENVEHMEKKHGFFVPDKQYLINLEGLIRYVSDKVALGKICLWCNGHGKKFNTLQAVQKHMVDKGHCKLLYMEGEDMEDLSEFYDFSAMYEGDEDDDHILTVDDLGEMHLPSGKVVGNRKFNSFYKQRFKPEDTRPAVLANKKLLEDRLMNQIVALGGTRCGALSTYVKDFTRAGKRVQRRKMMEQKKYENRKLKLGIQGNKLMTDRFKYRDPFV